MPYINQSKRRIFDSDIDALINKIKSYEKTDGDIDGIINYILSKLISETYNENKYSVLNRAVGVLTCVKDEFVRRRIIPYEEIKCKENGEVYKQ